MTASWRRGTISDVSWREVWFANRNLNGGPSQDGRLADGKSVLQRWKEGLVKNKYSYALLPQPSNWVMSFYG